MIRAASPAILAAILPALALVSAAPAFAKVSIQQGENACKAAANQQTPAPKSVRVDKDDTRASSGGFTYVLRLKDEAGVQSKLACKVDATGAATITGPAE